MLIIIDCKLTLSNFLPDQMLAILEMDLFGFLLIGSGPTRAAA